jgi:hypothetical protein
MYADPLTGFDAMVSAIEPGPRLIDALLLKELLNAAGMFTEAAGLDPGWRMVDGQLLRDLARQAGMQPRPIFGEPFQEIGPRLIDGAPWKELAEGGGVTPITGNWDDPGLVWGMPGLVWG